MLLTCAARLIINHCLKHGIGTIVFGWNKGQKQSIGLGTKTNQKFAQIPTARLKERIEQLCSLYGLQFVETEESYTSKASFLDGDVLPTYGEKPDNWEPKSFGHAASFRGASLTRFMSRSETGKRIQRGLYRSAAGYLINADCNGAANILRKVSGRLKLNLSQLSRGALTTPLRVRFWIS
ncbi:MAG: IS200/IS605 family accessory protein TnpB-related protein [Trichodesmium sp. MO_231.B1]|uniref:IS200/IS605 family accessory protein TnpB-related protein n=1 Tax=Okeania sp. SIO2F4 TaxID=2607790 RepID=UPI0026002B7C|nr:IS200/IS605 family accessory protein TnpB-related protein [Okeania sp. SIO2F4]MDJ0515309.1 IS200/IS605 family accessory protein TnpB-related protein [Trichodesmium sp. MO_231.B1]